MAARMMEDRTSVTGGTKLTAGRRESLQPALKAGTYLARCSGWVEIGTVPAFAGKAVAEGRSAPLTVVDGGWKRSPEQVKMQKRVMMTWTIRGAAGETWRVSREFALSAGPRAGLRKLLETWRGRPYASDDEARGTLTHPERLLDQACIVTVSVSPTGWPKIESVVGLPVGVPAPEPLRWPPVLFTWAKPDRETFQSLPAWVQGKVRGSEEWGRKGQLRGPGNASTLAHEPEGEHR